MELEFFSTTVGGRHEMYCFLLYGAILRLLYT